MAVLFFILLIVVAIAWARAQQSAGQARREAWELTTKINNLAVEYNKQFTAKVKQMTEEHNRQLARREDHALREVSNLHDRIRQMTEDHGRQLMQRTEQHAMELAQRAQRAVSASRGSYDGHIAEQAFPAAPHHRYHPKDIFHMGGVMDYAVFDGLHDIENGQRDPKTLTVVFAEVKWGTSRPSNRQKAVIAALNEGRIRGETWYAREDPPGQLTYDRRDAS